MKDHEIPKNRGVGDPIREEMMRIKDNLFQKKVLKTIKNNRNQLFGY